MHRKPLTLLPVVVAVGLAASCGSSSGGNPDAGADGTTPPKDGGPHHEGGMLDGHVGDGRPGDANGRDGMNRDVSPGDGPSADVEPGDGPALDAGPHCHKLEGDGSTLACTSPTGPTASAICAETGYESGPCPSSGLTGCCIFSAGNVICFYASDSVPASTEQATCKSGGGTWTTTAP